jgi:hypothetical protein
MKFLLALSVLLLAGCHNYEVVEYRQVQIVPSTQTITVYDEEPLDITTTAVEYDDDYF